LNHPKLKSLLDFALLREIVNKDAKNRFNLIYEPGDDNAVVTDEPPLDERLWWIRANQGHSMKVRGNHFPPIIQPIMLVFSVCSNQSPTNYIHGGHNHGRSWDNVASMEEHLYVFSLIG
jgi:RNA:NAD 2'-phosphotransferase (TPT1/KptA family)